VLVLVAPFAVLPLGESEEEAARTFSSFSLLLMLLSD
jgi:hypothetical protein